MSLLASCFLPVITDPEQIQSGQRANSNVHSKGPTGFNSHAPPRVTRKKPLWKVPTGGGISETVAYKVADTIPKAPFSAALHVCWARTVAGGRCSSGVAATGGREADARQTKGVYPTRVIDPSLRV